jgi:hypothetical protein
VFLGDFEDASGTPVVTSSVERPNSGLERRPAQSQPAVFDPPLAAVLRDAVTTELKRLDIGLAKTKETSDSVLKATIQNVSFDIYDDTLIGSSALTVQRAAIDVSVELSDRSGKTLRSGMLKGSGKLRRFGVVTTTREMILNQAVADAMSQLRRVFDAPEPRTAAPPVSAAAPWWETPVSK